MRNVDEMSTNIGPTAKSYDSEMLILVCENSLFLIFMHSIYKVTLGDQAMNHSTLLTQVSTQLQRASGVYMLWIEGATLY